MPNFDAIHEEACQKGEFQYTDPETGYRVFTAIALMRKAQCCGCGCRHCPYGHLNVPEETRVELQRDPWIEGELREGTTHDLLFWSGGKDSYLTLRALQKANERKVLLVNTFDGNAERVAHQDLTLEQIRSQAEALELPILFIPLYPGEDYEDRVTLGLGVAQRSTQIERLVFGDLHLEHIRGWREDVFGERFPEYVLHFPLWKVSYEKLMDDLFQSDATCKVSAVVSDACKGVIAVGDIYSPELIAKLPEGVDAFGENGEFHTFVQLG